STMVECGSRATVPSSSARPLQPPFPIMEDPQQSPPATDSGSHPLAPRKLRPPGAEEEAMAVAAVTAGETAAETTDGEAVSVSLEASDVIDNPDYYLGEDGGYYAH